MHFAAWIGAGSQLQFSDSLFPLIQLQERLAQLPMGFYHRGIELQCPLQKRNCSCSVLRMHPSLSNDKVGLSVVRVQLKTLLQDLESLGKLRQVVVGAAQFIE